MTELKPCPFCGSAAEFSRPTPVDKYCIVQCSNCDIMSESSRDIDNLASTWNTRVSPWQLIELAPKDGTHVDLWISRTDGSGRCERWPGCWWANEFDADAGESRIGWRDDVCFVMESWSRYKVTHFMLIPEGPNA